MKEKNEFQINSYGVTLNKQIHQIKEVNSLPQVFLLIVSCLLCRTLHSFVSLNFILKQQFVFYCYLFTIFKQNLVD